LKNLHKAALVSFKAEIVAGLNVEGYNFADVVTKARAGAEARFSEGSREAVVAEGDPTWQWEEELRMLREEIQGVANQLRKDETKKMVNSIEVRGSRFNKNVMTLKRCVA
jgi:protein SEY1